MLIIPNTFFTNPCLFVLNLNLALNRTVLTTLHQVAVLLPKVYYFVLNILTDEERFLTAFWLHVTFFQQKVNKNIRVDVEIEH